MESMPAAPTDALGSTGSKGAWCLLSARRSALTRKARWQVFAGLVFVCVAIALFVGLMFGGWWSLPFAGLEIVGLSCGFAWWDRHASDNEAIEITASEITVRSCSVGRIQEQRFVRAWARVERRHKPRTLGRPIVQLCVRSGGREAWFGSFLNEPAIESSWREVRAKLAQI